MHITGRKFCEFVVYISNDIFNPRINYDEKKWHEVIFPKLYKLYISAYVPEIILKTI